MWTDLSDLRALSTEPLTYWRATVKRPWGPMHDDVHLVRHVSAPPHMGIPVQEWFRDQVFNTDVQRDSLTNLVQVHDPASPPHLADEWAALTPSEQRDVLRWAAQVVRQDARRILRDA